MEILKASKKKTGPKPKNEQQKILSDLIKDGAKRFKPRSEVKDDLKYIHRLIKVFYRQLKKLVK